MRFHILALAHQCCTDRVTSCAYSMKVLNLARGLKAAGHFVILYHAGSDVKEGIADAYVQVVNDTTMAELYGPDFASTYNQGWKGGDKAWKEFQRRAAHAVAGNLQTDGTDFVLCSFGNLHHPACPAEAAAVTVEMGIGYEGFFAKRKVWESYAWQAYMHAVTRGTLDPRFNDAVPRGVPDPRYDTVIPNYLNAEAFTPNLGARQKHALFLGRVIESKGVMDAYQACQMVGIKLVIAGKGDPDFIARMPAAEYLGMVGQTERAKLLSEAAVLMCPTRYFEPFGGVAIEAAYSGTPTIGSDWGAFPETIIEGITGFRVRDQFQMAAALQNLGQIKSEDCHQWGSQFTLDRIVKKYERYFTHQTLLREHNA